MVRRSLKRILDIDLADGRRVSPASALDELLQIRRGVVRPRRGRRLCRLWLRAISPVVFNPLSRPRERVRFEDFHGFSPAALP
jgi:hypothetical protein